MRLPLLVLALGSLFIGWIGVPEAIGGGNALSQFLTPLFHLSTPEANGVSVKLEPLFMLVSFLVAGLGIGVAWYVHGLRRAPKAAGPSPAWKRLLERKYYVDELYQATVVKWVKGLARWFSGRLLEDLIVNRGIENLTRALYAWAGLFREAQTGLVRAYLAYVLAGAMVLVYWILH
jgi:NADH-quinone oxidoreductase subunit L